MDHILKRGTTWSPHVTTVFSTSLLHPPPTVTPLNNPTPVPNTALLALPPPPADRPEVLPPPEPPPVAHFPPSSLADAVIHPPILPIQYVGYLDTSNCSGLFASIHDCVTHISRTPRVCSLNGDSMSLVTSSPAGSTFPLINGGSNICITGDFNLLVNLVEILLVAISVALDGSPSSVDDTITKRGLLPLTLSNGTTYYQPCYYCTNLVETIISSAAVLASSKQFFYRMQVGCKDPTALGSLQFSNRNGSLTMSFNPGFRVGLYYCNMDMLPISVSPVIHCHCTVTSMLPDV